MTTAKETPSVSGLLPLKLSGRHYGDNLARLDLLLSSLLHYAPGLLDELVIVARVDEAERIGRYLANWPELPLRLVVEDEYFPAFERFSRPWQIRPWQRQQVIKLNAPAITGARYVLTLDPDVLAVKPITRERLLPGGRALLEPEPRTVHARWWRDSADLLDLDPELERPGINVTPAVLSTAVLEAVQRRLEAVGGRPWMDVLLTSYCDWTEYTLYLLAAEDLSLVARDHLWADDPAAPAHLHVDPRLSVWSDAGASGTDLARLFDAADPGLFAVRSEQQRPERGRGRGRGLGPLRDPPHRTRARAGRGERVAVRRATPDRVSARRPGDLPRAARASAAGAEGGALASGRRLLAIPAVSPRARPRRRSRRRVAREQVRLRVVPAERAGDPALADLPPPRALGGVVEQRGGGGRERVGVVARDVAGGVAGRDPRLAQVERDDRQAARPCTR